MIWPNPATYPQDIAQSTFICPKQLPPEASIFPEKSFEFSRKFAILAGAAQNDVGFILDQMHTEAHKTHSNGSPHGAKHQGIKRECGRADPKSGGLKPQPPPRLYAESALLRRHWETGKATKRIDPQARRPALLDETPPVGCDGSRREDMTTEAQAIAAPQTKSVSSTLSIFAAAFIGLGIIAVAGHVQASTLHDAAHDVRHATGFPCH